MSNVKNCVSASYGLNVDYEMQEAVDYMLSKPSRKLTSPNHSKELTYEGFAAISDAAKGAYLKVVGG